MESSLFSFGEFLGGYELFYGEEIVLNSFGSEVYGKFNDILLAS
jgi:hypothetical protein